MNEKEKILILLVFLARSAQMILELPHIDIFQIWPKGVLRRVVLPLVCEYERKSPKQSDLCGQKLFPKHYVIRYFECDLSESKIKMRKGRKVSPSFNRDFRFVKMANFLLFSAIPAHQKTIQNVMLSVSLPICLRNFISSFFFQFSDEFSHIMERTSISSRISLSHRK